MSQLRVLVTGGGRGIGRAIALRFAREGAKVVVAARTSTELDAVVVEIGKAGGEGLPAQVDVRDYGSVEAAVWRATEFTGGGLDVLVNNAGVFEPKPFAELDLDSWQRALEVNLTGAFHVTRETLEALEQSPRAHVFNVASVAAQRAFPGNVAYCASKYGLRGFGDALREDLREAGIRVSTVYPSATDTEIWRDVPGDWDRSKMLKPEAVAEAIWLAYQAPPDRNVDDIELGAGAGD